MATKKNPLFVTDVSEITSADKLTQVLTAAVIDWDRKQSMKRGHNPWALGQYLAVVEACGLDFVESRAPMAVKVGDIIDNRFNDRLRDYCRKACGLKPMSKEAALAVETCPF